MRYVKITVKTCTSEKHEKAVKISTRQGKSHLVLSNPFRLWVTVWVRRKTKKYDRIILMKYKEKFLISQEIRNFLVETTGLEPVTSCV